MRPLGLQENLLLCGELIFFMVLMLHWWDHKLREFASLRNVLMVPPRPLCSPSGLGLLGHMHLESTLEMSTFLPQPGRWLGHACPGLLVSKAVWYRGQVRSPGGWQECDFWSSGGHLLDSRTVWILRAMGKNWRVCISRLGIGISGEHGGKSLSEEKPGCAALELLETLVIETHCPPTLLQFSSLLYPHHVCHTHFYCVFPSPACSSREPVFPKRFGDRQQEQ